MTIRNLDALFKPESVAVIGASRRAGSVGAVLARNLFNGGFDGPVMPVNPKHRAVAGVLAYPDVESLPVTPDLAVICTPPRTVPDIVAQLAERGTRGAVVITAGFGEGGDDDGMALRQRMLEAARPHLMRIIGPNCLGILVPGQGLNASFSHLAPAKGRLAFVTQSGAIVTSVLDWAERRGIGFSHMVSLGDMSDVDFGDMLDYLANDPETRAILLYVEAVTDARKFMSAARAAARMKPVIVVKSGRHAASAKAAASHTGALAGSDAVYDAAFRRAGMLRVDTLGELFAAVETVATTRLPEGDRLAILTNGGGIGVLATDALMDRQGHLAELSEETLKRLDDVLPPTWSHGNPVDIIGDAPGKRYADALAVLTEAQEADAVLVLNCPTAVADSMDAAEAVVAEVERRGQGGPRPTVLTCWVGEYTAQRARQRFADARIPSYTTPEGAVRAFMHVVDYRRSQEALLETPPSVPEVFTPDTERARRLVDDATAEGREWLTEPEAKALLDAYGVSVVPTEVARDPGAAAAAADRLGYPAAVKILSADITHKSDVGGVVLDLEDAGQVRHAAEAMQRRVAETYPDARLEGFSVQPMVRRAGAWELIAGFTEDAQFGPVVLFGQGGTAVEVIRDQALGLPPLNLKLAHEIIERTRIHRQLVGYRDRKPADLEAIAITLMRIAQIAADLSQVRELDINPLLASSEGVVALDARVRLGGDDRGAKRLAIRPYPRELEETVHLDDGREFLLRPILPEDEPAVHRAFAQLTPEQIRMRFFAPIKQLSHVAAARFTQIDYDREMALVLTETGRPAGEADIFGVVHIHADPDNERAEYAVIVSHELTRRGLGRLLMERVIDYARRRGIREIRGDVLQENRAMLTLCKQLGFHRRPDPEDREIVHVRLPLTGAGEDGGD
ncbi:bifunctional acetate--CoA ligase family protein/GNAT family N-acetyltransferase [Spiribacter halobius]|uniref:GNAT family N-acetyltransferase n=1 Tax=Sediminicurvatus halobius TaxID=2182432 RepID=A0A2U2N0H6_9GAMM|nr:bifunctional acetate--CoA ligase family protein/GNAT family N-acetyltransferase [Spiribacter halobius]PWG62568.1 GNAT family N-acetyltransferase [Spiribacter halobius]UEX78518.1 bifunctional acetate--CoA ligase family protein/GNAT family N-acetyltransferase [Spiribacter halobius]